MFCCKVAVLLSNILELSRGRIQDLDVGSNILIPINCAEIEEGLIGNAGKVKLMVAYCQDIIIDVLKNWVGKQTIRRSRITEAIAIVEVA